MKCPKCHYLSFDPEPRCRNCGYTLALDDADLTIEHAEEAEPPVDLMFRPEADRLADADDVAPADTPPAESRPAPRRRRRTPAARGPFDGPELVDASPAETPAIEADSVDDGDLVAPVPEPEPAPLLAAPEPLPPPPPLALVERPEPAIRPAPEPVTSDPVIRQPKPSIAPPTAELPLFVKPMAPAEPEPRIEPAATVASTASEPDIPIARPSAASVSSRVAAAAGVAAETTLRPPAAEKSRKLGPLDHDLLEDLERIETNERREAAATATAGRVGIASRLGAAVVDALLLGGLSAGVVWATLRWCELPMEQVRVLPIAPTVAFLLLVGLGYLLLFTAAGGQTIGKMLFGIRVVGDETPYATGGALSLRQAVYREVVSLPSILALGLGFLPALFGDERALHDRLAQTRVVRA
jgi:uncharacterized RDD family membrane protein YckC